MLKSLGTDLNLIQLWIMGSLVSFHTVITVFLLARKWLFCLFPFLELRFFNSNNNNKNMINKINNDNNKNESTDWGKQILRFGVFFFFLGGGGLGALPRRSHGFLLIQTPMAEIWLRAIAPPPPPSPNIPDKIYDPLTPRLSYIWRPVH